MKKTINKDFFEDLQPEFEKYVNWSVEISDRIEEILEKKKITQRELAEKLGKSESEISKWLSGTHNFTLKSLAKIESILNEEILKICKDRKDDAFSKILDALAVSFQSNTFFDLENKTSSYFAFLDDFWCNKKSKVQLQTENFIDITSKNLITIENGETKRAA